MSRHSFFGGKIMTGADTTIVITTYNDVGTIEDCLAGLFAQTEPPAAICVADGDSLDGTQEIVARLAKLHDRLRLAVHHGSAAARANLGWREADTALVAYLGADCLAPSDWLARLAGGFASVKAAWPELVGVGGSIRAAGTGLPGRLLDMLPSGPARGSSRRPVQRLPVGNCLYERETLGAFGGFVEHLRPGQAGPDLGRRLTEGGRGLIYEPGCAVRRRYRTLWSQLAATRTGAANGL
jgi:glycosyltransferase involved in cell wall biosynthesis